MDQGAIDIKYSDLLQWLEERYLIPKDWPNRLEIIKTKKSELIDELFKQQSQEMKKLQNTFKIFKQTPIENIPYNDYSKLYMQLTKTEEAKNKSLFGKYNSPFIYSAYLLDCIYNKNNMHLAENSKIIIQNVSYEIPLYKKQNVDLKNLIAEQDSKSESKNEQIILYKQKIKNLFKEHGIELDIENSNSNKIALSLIDKIIKDNYLENLLNNIEDQIKNNKVIEKSINIYEDFYQTIYNNKDDDNKNIKYTLTPTLYKFYKNGDYMVEDGSNNSENNIKDSKILRNKYITYRTNIYKMNYTEQDTNKYNFNLIDESSNKINNNANNEKINIVPSSTCLLNNLERNMLLADINEILLFINQRQININNKEEINLSMYNQNLKNFNIKYSNEDFTESKKCLENIYKLINSKELVFLLEILNDEENIKGIINSYNEMKIQSSKLNNMINDLKKKNNELLNEIKENEKKIKEVQKIVVTLRKVTEIFLTKLWKRKINIMGDENLITK